ncbi:MAG: hypothetical protein GF355_16095 [Candidatus Eisenbacteria bacterium]|nr:hypothetical protein [Candidatus Eisenbacteria bacterium]
MNRPSHRDVPPPSGRTPRRLPVSPALPHIAGIGLAVPAHKYRQEKLVRFMARAHGFDTGRARALQRLYQRTQIMTRHSCLPDYGRESNAFEFFPRNERLVPAPTTGARMERFRLEAPELARRACADLFQRPGMPEPREVDHLFAVTCTGFFAPGLDVALADALGLRPDVGRTMISFQGCQGGLTALRLADAVCRARPGATALIVSVELCTLHFRTEASEENLVANALFADGSAAVLVTSQPASGESVRLELTDTATWLEPGSRREMVWTVGDAGFVLRLSDLVPGILAAGVPGLLGRVLDMGPGDLKRLPLWAVHPGGPAILDGLERALGLDERASGRGASDGLDGQSREIKELDGGLDQVEDAVGLDESTPLPGDDTRGTSNELAPSRNVLRRYGNVSSAAIFFVLREILDDPSRCGPGLALAFGPGLTVEAARFHKTSAARDTRRTLERARRTQPIRAAALDPGAQRSGGRRRS